MTRQDVKDAADALGRLEAIEAAIQSVGKVPHEAFPISFFSAGEDEDYPSDARIKAYYPRDLYLAALERLRVEEENHLDALGIRL